MTVGTRVDLRYTAMLYRSNMAVHNNWSTLNATKLFIPTAPEDFVPRRRLNTLLDRIPHRPLALVSAPAGYGKSTAVAAWLRASAPHRAWLSLDDTDNDFSIFLIYFVAAIRRAVPAFGVELREMLEVGWLPSPRTFVEFVFAELDKVGEDVVLVIEDCHFIRSEDVLGALLELMRHPHPLLHLVLLSRHDVPLPLNEWRARNWMIDIRAADLRFSLEETAVFLNQAMPRPPNHEMVSTLHKNTEGWIAGLRLALLTLTRIEEFDGRNFETLAQNRHIVEYLAEQVLGSLPAERQSFLIQTSILDRMCGQLCDAVVAAEGDAVDGQALLLDLNRENLFMIPLDDEMRWFRSHHLLSEFLRGRLARNYSPEQIAEFHRRAGGWFAAAGFFEEAIRHMLAAGETDAAVGLVAAKRHDLLNQERWQRLHIWLHLFPEEVITNSPDLLQIRAWFAHALRFDVEELKHITGEIDALLDRLDLEPASAQLLRAENDILRSIPRYFNLDAAETVAYCRLSLQALPKAYYALRAYAWLYAAAALRLLGDLNGAYELMRQAKREDLMFSDYPRARNSVASGLLYWLDAELEPLIELGEYGLGIASTGDQRNSMSWSHYFLACVHYHQNNLAEAAFHAQQVFDARFTSVGISNIYGGFILALVHQVSGHRDKAGDTMRLVSAYATEIRSPALMMLAQAFQAELNILDGQINKAVRVAEEILLHDRPAVTPLFYEPRLTALKALLLLDDPLDADRLADYLRRLREHAESIHNVRVLIEVLALEAMFHDSRGDERVAYVALERSLALAEPSGFIRLYVDLGPRMMDLLGRFRRGKKPADYEAHILAAFPSPKPADNGALIEPLTDRELQVLSLLARRYSNKEIAAELVISPTTVKRHTINIYQKLYVQSRRSAVETAQRLGIIE